MRARALLGECFSRARLGPGLALSHPVGVERATSIVDCIVDRGVPAAAAEELVALGHRQRPLRTHELVEQEASFIELDHCLSRFSSLLQGSGSIFVRLRRLRLERLLLSFKLLNLLLELKGDLLRFEKLLTLIVTALNQCLVLLIEGIRLCILLLELSERRIVQLLSLDFLANCQAKRGI